MEHDTNVDKLKLTDPCTPNKSLSTASTITLRGTPDGSSYLTSCNIVEFNESSSYTSSDLWLSTKHKQPTIAEKFSQIKSFAGMKY